MKLLAWDTSSKAGAIVALEGKEDSDWNSVKLVAEFALNVEATHSERLLWGIHQVLESARWSLSDIDALGVGVGPGSFTGLRIGITTARTLSQSLEKPLIGVSSLAALARPVALSVPDDTLVVVTTDACKNELFALWGKAGQVRQCVSKDLWSNSVSEEVLRAELLMEKLQDQGPWVSVGEGRFRYPDSWKSLDPEQELKCSIAFPHQIQGRYLGMLMWEAIQNKLLNSGLEVLPRYLRASDAELKLKNKNNQVNKRVK